MLVGWLKHCLLGKVERAFRLGGVFASMDFVEKEVRMKQTGSLFTHA